MKVSVLLPTRKRPEALLRTLNSVKNTFSGNNEIEYLLRFDDDDWDTVYKVAEAFPEAKFVVGKRYGYEGIHHYLNELSKVATGDWLFFLNDDAVVETSGWDEEVAKFNGQIVFLDSQTNHDISWLIFPIIPKSVPDFWGHFALNRQCDAYLNDIAEQLHIKHMLPVRILHDRADLTGNNRDEIYEGRTYDKTFYEPFEKQKRNDDAEKLKGFIEKQSLTI